MFFRMFLLAATVLIYVFTVAAINSQGFNWPAVALADLQAMNWRSQFDFDFIVYLLMTSAWMSWREEFSVRGKTYAVLNVVMGGMFAFPYVLYLSYASKGDPRKVLLGAHSAHTSAST
ncbi:MAG: hypothetical protein ACE366_09770 [Bradymonadia bacterium]